MKPIKFIPLLFILLTTQIFGQDFFVKLSSGLGIGTSTREYNSLEVNAANMDGLVIFLTKNDIVKFIRAFPSENFYCPPSEIIKSELEQTSGGHFNLIHHESGFKADIYIAGTDELQIWAMKNAKQIEFEDSIIFIAPPEYVIINKLEFYREGKSQKHLTDIKGILNNSSELINFDFLNSVIKERALI